MARSDEERFTELFHELYGDLFAYVLRRTKDRELTDYVIQTTMIFAWRHLDEIPSKDRTRPWVFLVAKRTLSNHWRSVGRRRQLFERQFRVARSQSQENADDFGTSTITEAFERLMPQQQEVLRLAYWEGLPHLEAAKIFGCTVNAFDIRLHRAVRNLERTYWEITGVSTAHHGLDPQSSKVDPVDLEDPNHNSGTA